MRTRGITILLLAVCAAAGDDAQLTTAEVDGLVTRAALALDAPTLVVAVADRAGNPLAIYRRPGATAAVETALSLARTGAFFSNNEAPLSSRTVRSISRENFPEGIPNQPAGALFGIENTNRGCRLSDNFLPDKAVPPSRNADGTGPGAGIAVIPGGIPVYRDGVTLIGGIGVAGVDLMRLNSRSWPLRQAHRFSCGVRCHFPALSSSTDFACPL